MITPCSTQTTESSVVIPNKCIVGGINGKVIYCFTRLLFDDWKVVRKVCMYEISAFYEIFTISVCCLWILRASIVHLKSVISWKESITRLL